MELTLLVASPALQDRGRGDRRPGPRHSHHRSVGASPLSIVRRSPSATTPQTRVSAAKPDGWPPIAPGRHQPSTADTGSPLDQPPPTAVHIGRRPPHHGMEPKADPRPAALPCRCWCVRVDGSDRARGLEGAQGRRPAAVLLSLGRPDAALPSEVILVDDDAGCRAVMGGPFGAYVADVGDSYASPSGLATTTVYPSGSRSQISRWPGPLP